MSILEVEHISKSFDKTEVLRDIRFSMEKSQVLKELLRAKKVLPAAASA